jgi:hypothetical protein
VSLLSSSGADLGAGAAPMLPTVVTLNTAIKPLDFLLYSSVTISRTGPSLPAAANLDGTSFTVVPSQVLDVNGNPTDAHWSVDSHTGFLVYQETLDPLLGIGGRNLSYAVTSETLAIADQGVSEPGGLSQSLALPVHPGVMAVQILDMKGNVVTVGTDGKVTGNAHALFVDETGRVQVRYVGTGIDTDSWTVGVHELIPQKVDNVTIMQDVQLGGAGNANLTYAYDVSTFDAATNRYPAQTLGVTLAFGDNNIQVQWVQAMDGKKVLRKSTLVDLDFEKSFDGRFVLNLTTPASPAVRQSDNGAIVVSPGQELDFSLTDTNTDDGPDTLTGVQWDFDDGGTGQGSTLNHKYHQLAVQDQDHLNYVIKVTKLPGDQTAKLPVVVQDTQDGALYENEVWNGPHTVTGNVLVPSGMSLEVGTLAGVSTSVTFSGGLAASVHQGLTVQGRLSVGLTGDVGSPASTVAVGFASDPANPSLTGQGWGTILVEGSAQLSGAVISGADRGVTAAGSSVVLTGVSLAGNTTGLHAVTGSVLMSGSKVSGNTGYGVKEDGARPVMTQNVLEGNGMDYYQSGTGAVSLDELNSVNGNSGNTE